MITSATMVRSEVAASFFYYYIMGAKTLVFIGYFTESEVKYVEELSKSLPERHQPYTFVKLEGRIALKGEGLKQCRLY